MNTVMNSMNVRRNYLTKGEVGIEIEVEGADLPILVRGGPWRCEYDGSLKGRETQARTVSARTFPYPMAHAGTSSKCPVLTR